MLDWFFYVIFYYECGCETFKQVTFLRKVSKFIAGTEQDALIPIPSFACTNCGHVNNEFQPKNLDK